MVSWKSNDSMYYTFTSAYKKNTKPDNYIAHKPRPIVHYRKQYTMDSSSRYYGNHLSTYTSPGANIVSMKAPADNCIGFSGVADYMLDAKKIAIIQRKILVLLKVVKQKKNVYLVMRNY